VKHFFPTLSTVEVAEAAKQGRVAILPIGTVEANGLSVPLGSDYLIPEALAEAVAKKTDSLYMPPVPYGVSHTLDSYPGTIVFSEQLLKNYVEAIVTSLISFGFSHVLLLTYHLPNHPPVAWALREVRRKTGVMVPSINPGTVIADVRDDLFPEGPQIFGHGSEPASSLLMHLHPGIVNTEFAEPIFKPKIQGLQILTPESVAFGESKLNLFMDIEHVSPTSGWGDASNANAERGKALFERVTDRVADFVTAFSKLDTRAESPAPQL
jgi:creatinine amidohydrolase